MTGDASALILSGQGPANSDILIYVFSEPLVLTSETDENGNWTYVLENPLEPGDHEIYAAVADDSGNFERSDQLAFSVSQVASTEENPNGLSLTLASTNNTTAVQYMVGAAGVVLLALIAFLIVIYPLDRASALLPHLNAVWLMA